MTCQDYTVSPTDCGFYLKVVFLSVTVTKVAQFDQFDQFVWPRTLRSQVSTYNIDTVQLRFLFPNVNFLFNE